MSSITACVACKEIRMTVVWRNGERVLQCVMNTIEHLNVKQIKNFSTYYGSFGLQLWFFFLHVI